MQHLSHAVSSHQVDQEVVGNVGFKPWTLKKIIKNAKLNFGPNSEDEDEDDNPLENIVTTVGKPIQDILTRDTPAMTKVHVVKEHLATIKQHHKTH